LELFRQCDFHVHSILSPCAEDEMILEDIINTAIDRGIKYLGINNHISIGTDLSIFQKTRDEIAKINPNIQVFVGCEADIICVGKNLASELIRKELDFVSVASNHFQVSYVEQPPSKDLRDIGLHFLKLFKYACSLDYVDVIVHPMIEFMKMFDPTCFDLLEDEEILEALYLAKENNIAMEITPRALIKNQLYFRYRFYELCKQVGLKFSIGSDAHHLETVAPGNLLAGMISKLGITDDDLWMPKMAVK
jgi:histidinol phosphatase-like PHP family hydrolase